MSRFTLLAVTLLNAAYLVTSIRIMGLAVLLGGDEDSYGCKPSAGYVWCNETDSCIPMNQICTSFDSDYLYNLTAQE